MVTIEVDKPPEVRIAEVSTTDLHPIAAVALYRVD
jgi:hypothetical protein